MIYIGPISSVSISRRCTSQSLSRPDSRPGSRPCKTRLSTKFPPRIIPTPVGGSKTWKVFSPPTSLETLGGQSFFSPSDSVIWGFLSLSVTLRITTLLVIEVSNRLDSRGNVTRIKNWGFKRDIRSKRFANIEHTRPCVCVCVCTDSSHENCFADKIRERVHGFEILDRCVSVILVPKRVVSLYLPHCATHVQSVTKSIPPSPKHSPRTARIFFQFSLPSDKVLCQHLARHAKWSNI